MRSHTSTTAAMTAATRVSQPEPLILCSSASDLLFAAPPVVIGPLFQQRGPARKAGPHADYPWLPLEVRYVDDPVERELAAFDGLDGELGEARVALLVEAPGAEHALEALGGEDLVKDSLALGHPAGLVGGPLDGVEHHVGGLVGVGGIGLDLVVVLALVGLDELLALGGELALRQAAEGDVDAVGRVAGLAEKLVNEDTVGANEEDLVVGHPGADLVLDELGGVVLDDAAEVDGVGLGLGDLVHERAVVGGRAVDALTPENLDALPLGGLLELVGEALAVGLLVVEDVDGLHVLLNQKGGAGLALLVVGHDHAGVVALAGRVVLVWLVGLAAGLREADVRVGRADHREAGLVEGRYLGGRTTGVERAYPAYNRLVLGCLLRVLGALGRVPRTGLRRGVVEGLVIYLETRNLPVALLDGQLDGVDHRRRLGAVGALQRQVADDLDRLPTTRVAAATARAAASYYQQGGQQPRHHQCRYPTRLPQFSSSIPVTPNSPPRRHQITNNLVDAALWICILRFVKQAHPARGTPFVRWYNGPRSTRRSGGIGRRAGLKIRFPQRGVSVRARPPVLAEFLQNPGLFPCRSARFGVLHPSLGDSFGDNE